jgi:integrase
MPRHSRGTRLGDRPNSSGFWEIVWTEANGRTRRASTGQTNRREAERALASFILTRDQIAAEEASKTIAGIVAAYETGHIQNRAVDVERALFAGKAVLAFFGDMLPKDITDDTLLRYQAWRKGVGPATVRRELEHLRAALNYAVRNRHLPIGEKPHISLPPRVEPRSRTLTDDELARLLSTHVIERGYSGKETGRLSRIHRFVQIMLRAPARPAAIETLTWFQVDLKKRLIDYRMPGRVRTKKRRTAVPISTDLMPILQRAYAERQSEFVLDMPGSTKRVFNNLVAACGFPDVTPYVLRHTYGSVAIARGVPPALVAEVMGDTVETIMRNYKHLIPGHLRAAVEGVWGPIVTSKEETG